jgi:hypothetical protein
MGPFKLPIPHRFGTLETALPSPTLFETSDAKRKDSAEKQQSEFRAVRPKCHRYLVSLIRAQSLLLVAHQRCSIDQRCDATPSDPPVALDQLELTAPEYEIHAKLVEMFGHQVSLLRSPMACCSCICCMICCSSF